MGVRLLYESTRGPSPSRAAQGAPRRAADSWRAALFAVHKSSARSAVVHRPGCSGGASCGCVRGRRSAPRSAARQTFADHVRAGASKLVKDLVLADDHHEEPCRRCRCENSACGVIASAGWGRTRPRSLDTLRRQTRSRPEPAPALRSPSRPHARPRPVEHSPARRQAAPHAGQPPPGRSRGPALTLIACVTSTTATALDPPEGRSLLPTPALPARAPESASPGELTRTDPHVRTTRRAPGIVSSGGSR